MNRAERKNGYQRLPAVERNAYLLRRRRGKRPTAEEKVGPRFHRAVLRPTQAQSPVPQQQLTRLWTAIDSAVHLAMQGRNLQGYLALCAARANRDRGSETVVDEWYDRALDYYREHHLGVN